MCPNHWGISMCQLCFVAQFVYVIAVAFNPSPLMQLLIAWAFWCPSFHCEHFLTLCILAFRKCKQEISEPQMLVSTYEALEYVPLWTWRWLLYHSVWSRATGENWICYWLELCGLSLGLCSKQCHDRCLLCKDRTPLQFLRAAACWLCLERRELCMWWWMGRSSCRLCGAARNCCRGWVSICRPGWMV